ncbi:hypothetical protein [Marmoricola sp. URHB0036]|uniref:hypothetical protein n=1 Tax=Marmoricola sp. URHB0036 TaxID=1298863 RepID=UPI0012DF74F9|nr:hypothetical protein [Marmoricola sp. URHB0036]
MTGDDELPVAVVVVHGIGQQLPMDTLRSLVDTLWGPGPGARAGQSNDGQEIFNKVDRHSSFLDLRRLSLATGYGHPRVDFFELYWAAAFGSGTVGQVLAWAARLLGSRPRGAQMKQIVWTTRLAVLVFVAAAASIFVVGSAWGWWAKLAFLLPFLGAIGLVARQAARTVLADVLSDASRWFAPSPKDIAGRDKVRQLGLGLLQSLHKPDEDGCARYGRIVVVGHSLGSVVAYDVLRIAFDRLRAPSSLPGETLVVPLSKRQCVAWNYESERVRLNSGSAADMNKRVRAFQYVQRQLHGEQRDVGVPWLVTDLITVGSPLTHAADLWRSKAAEFPRRVTEGEFPVCPPIGEFQHSERQRARQNQAIPTGADSVPICFYRKVNEGPLIAHEASLFASTRWTNLYIPMRWWLGGDPVGGPLLPIFGPGVKDVPVRVSAPQKRRRAIMAVPVRAHTWYWRRHPDTSQDDIKDREGLRDAVRQLEIVINLREKRATPYRFRSLLSD